MNVRVFRMYDIRGKVGIELFVEEVAAIIKALVVYCKMNNLRVKNVLVARDGRTHSPSIAHEVIKGFLESGIDG